MTQLRQIAEATAATFPGLLVAAERIADTVIHGVHGRRRAGPGEDFWQFRPYSAGDAASRIDWRRSAKRNRLFIRENEWAATNTLWTHVPAGPSMRYCSELAGTSKYERAATIALALSILAAKAGERVGIVNSGIAPGHSRATVTRLADWYENPPAHALTDSLPENPDLPGHASCVLLADFFDSLEKLRQRIGFMAAAGIKGHIVQILDPIEESFPFAGRTEFLDPQSPRKFLAGKAENFRAAYLEKLEKHRAGLRDIAHAVGWSFCLHHTDTSPHLVVLNLHHQIADTAFQTLPARTGS